MIYVIQAGTNGPIKIGYAIDPKRRIRQLQTASSEALSLIKVFPGDKIVENRIHTDLRQFRKRGEWFDVSDDVFAYLRRFDLVEYEVLENIPYLILWRDSLDSATAPCGFCGIRHFHGVPDGHRTPHCATKDAVVVAKDGVTLHQTHGYLVRTRTSPEFRLDAHLTLQQDSIDRFLDEYCVFDEKLTRNSKARTANQDIYRAYVRFCNGQGDDPLSHRQLSQRLKHRGIRQIVSGGRYWERVRLKQDNLNRI